MRLAIAGAALLAVAASRNGCGDGASGHDPCAGRACDGNGACVSPMSAACTGG